MFLHNFKYSLKVLLRSKMLLFWTFAFPIILGFFFNMAFSNIENSEKLDIIDIAIVDNEDFRNSEIFKEAFETLSDEENEDRMFNTKYVTEEEVKTMLENSEITGYIKVDGESIDMIVNTSGINETIIKCVIDEIQSNKEMTQSLVEKSVESELRQENFNINYEEIIDSVQKTIEESNIKLNDISNNNLSYTMIEYYTLIAMACLYGRNIINVCYKL